MINNLDEFTAASVIQLVESIEPGSGGSLKVLIPMMSCHEVVKNKTLFHAGQENRYEYLLLDGLLRSLILDEKGNETTVAGPSRLSDFLSDVFRNILGDPESAKPKMELLQSMNRTAELFGYEPSLEINNDSPIQSIGDHGRWLYSTYGIRQFIILSDSGMLREYRERL